MLWFRAIGKEAGVRGAERSRCWAMGRRTIAVAGCGVGGLAVALLLARAGHKVELFERFEAPRPLGSGLMLQPTGLAVLDRLGLLDRVVREGARIDRLHGVAGQRVVLDVGYAALRKADHWGVGIHRACLFAALHDAVVEQGIPIHGGRAISGSRMVRDRRELVFDGGQASDGFELIVDALGTRTTLAPPTGRELTYGALWASVDWPEDCALDPRTLTQRYRRSSRMAGILPLGTGGGAKRRAALFWSLKGSAFPAWRDAGLGAWQKDVRAFWPECAPFLDQIRDEQGLTFARYAHRTLRAPVEERMIHIGDAWHSASPQLGQGANMALLDAWALAVGLSAHGQIDQALAHAVQLRRRHVLLYQWLTWLFTPVYQSDSRVLPIVRDQLVGPISRLWPATAIQAAMVSGLIGNPLGPLGLGGAGK